MFWWHKLISGRLIYRSLDRSTNQTIRYIITQRGKTLSKMNNLRKI